MKLYTPIFVHYSVYLFVLLWLISLGSPTPQALADENKPTLQVITQLAEQGDAESQYLLGKKYLFGNGVEKNKLKGCEWSLKAAEQGHAKGQNNIGLCYDHGWGGLQNLEKAAYWYGKAAKLGQEHGQYNLAKLYHAGEGVKKDASKAFSLYLSAASQGLVGAQVQVGGMYEFGMGVASDPKQAALWYTKAAGQGNSKAQIGLGFLYKHGEGVQQNYQESANWFQKAAAQGDASAQYNLGLLYEKGKVLIQDFKQAISLYHQAADQGHMNAQMSLALYYSEDGEYQDLEKAVHWSRKAAEQGDSFAQYMLGVYYEIGDGVKQNYTQAAVWYHKAAEQGDVPSQRLLGVFYENGTGVPQNYHEAVEWYQKAAEQGDAQSQNNLGWLFEQGKGVKQDYKKAVALFKKSAEQGYARAQTNLGWMYDRGDGVERDYEIAMQWYRKAAEQNNAMAQNSIGVLYLNGNGLQQNHYEAVKWFVAAAKQNLAIAQRNVGMRYEDGRGVEQDYKIAAQWYLKAANQDDHSAQYLLGYLYYAGHVGEGVKYNHEIAFKWFKKAAEGGDATSQNFLAEMYLVGKGVYPDRKIAKLWFQKSAAQGNEKAKRSLQQLERLHKVFLVINKKGHSGPIEDLVFSNDGKLLISASSDKTIEVWNVDSGKKIRTISGEIGPGDDGEFTTISLSRSGNLLAAGGDFPGSSGDIRIFDINTGDLIKVLSGHTYSIYDLTFSFDDNYLLSCSFDNTARIWDVSTGELVNSFTHDNSVRRGLFLQDTNIIVTTAGKDLYWWNIQNGKLVRKIQAHKKEIWSLVSLLNGNILSGGTDFMLNEWDSKSGRKISEFKTGQPVTDMSIDKHGDRWAWSRPDSFGVSSLKEDANKFHLEIEEKSIENSYHFISSSSISPNGKRAAVGHADGKIFLVDIDNGRIITDLSAPVARIKKVGFSLDGAKLIWQQQGKTYGLQVKNDKGLYKLGDVVKELHEQPTLAAEKTEVNGWSITLPNKENDLIEIRKKGELLHSIGTSGGNDKYYDTQLTPDGKTILTYNGGSFVTAYDVASGEWLWQRPFNAATGTIDDIAISPDSRFLVVGETDQTIKLYEIETGNLLLTLFFDGEKEWIAWNPDGYYTGSLGGDQLISWHLNQGPDKAALRFPARQFSIQFYSPGQITATLSGKEQQTLTAQKISSTKKKKKIKPIQDLIPPVVSFLEPTDLILTVTSQKVRIRGKAVSKNSEPINDIWVLVNGRRAEIARRVMPSQKNMKKLDGLSAEIDITVNIPDEHTIISLIASNRYSQSAPLMFEVNKPDKSLQVQFDTAWNDKSKAKKPNLYILAVGVSDYKQRDISLNFAHNDAEGIANAFAGQEGKLYGKVYERVLTNEKATRDNILDGLDWLMSEATQKDITVLFIAGHGLKDQSGNYYFLPYDYDINALRRSGLRWNEFNDVLYKLPSKIILMADTCHSGSITGKTQGSNISNVLREIVGSEGGIVVLTASTGDEVSIERSDWGHGAFSKAVIEGLKGEAEGKPIDNVIDILELASYTNKRVKILTAGRQHATTEIPRVLPTFDLIAL